MQKSAVDLSKKFRVLAVYKQLYKYLKLDRNITSSVAINVKNNSNSLIDQLRDEFRQNSVTDSKYCMRKDEMLFLATTYATYLDSTRKTLDLYSRYCRGERSIQEAAQTVGLRLPKTYTEPAKE